MACWLLCLLLRKETGCGWLAGLMTFPHLLRHDQAEDLALRLDAELRFENMAIGSRDFPICVKDHRSRECQSCRRAVFSKR